MRYQDQQYDDTHAEAVKSDPVPVPPRDLDEANDEVRDEDRHGETTSDSRTDEEPVADEASADRGTLDDPVPDDPAPVDERAEAERGNDDGRSAVGDPGEVADAREDSGIGRADTEQDLAAAGPVGAEADPEADDRFEPMPQADLDRDRDLDVDRGGESATTDADLDRSGYDRDHVAEPAPQPTAFGAGTVGGAAAAAAAATERRDEAHDVRDEDTARRGDGTVADEPASDQLAYDPDEDLARGGDGPVDDQLAYAAPADADRTRSAAGAATAADTMVDGQPVGEVAPTGQLMPGDVPAEPMAALLSPEAGQGFRERWREVQLRFVDDPRNAAGDAQQLVEEAVEALTRALAEQKDELASWGTDVTGDTENLRLAVRRYRDFLDRVLGL